MAPEIPNHSTVDRRQQSGTLAFRAPWGSVVERLRVLHQLRADQIGGLLVLIVGMVLLSVAPMALVLTLGFLALTVGLLGVIPLLLARVIETP